MNDRFKFRVWFNGLKRYSRNTDNLVLNDCGELGEFDTVGCYSEKDAVVEQCTGLKDKNGKLIYEGDILKTLDGRICWVIWMGTSFWLKSPGSGAYDLEYNSFYEHCEVIGNIHENPELLKESK